MESGDATGWSILPSRNFINQRLRASDNVPAPATG